MLFFSENVNLFNHNSQT